MKKESISQIIKKYIPKNSTVILAFSGGPDSVFLLNRLIKFNNIHTYKIVLAHFNHGLRGKESDKDEMFSKKTAKRFNLNIETSGANIREFSVKNKLNLEDAARIKRYDFLEKVRKKHKAKFILTAHHLNDNLETFLLNFLRGSGVRGLKSLQIKRGNILRPLLLTTKKEILEYLKGNKIKYRTDSSNKDIAFNRNFLRLEIIPKLEKIQPNLSEVYFRTWVNNLEIFDYIDKTAKNWIKTNSDIDFEIKISNLNKLHPAILKAVISQIFNELYSTGKGISSVLIERVMNLISNGKSGKKIKFGKNFFAFVNAGKISFITDKAQKKITRKKIKINGVTTFSNGIITSKVTDKIPKNLHNQTYLNMEKLNFPLYVRAKKNGDRFRPLGLNGTKKIQDIFTDFKIPQHKRNGIPIITDCKDNIIALGINIVGENYKITKNTKQALKMEIQLSPRT